MKSGAFWACSCGEMPKQVKDMMGTNFGVKVGAPNRKNKTKCGKCKRVLSLRGRNLHGQGVGISAG